MRRMYATLLALTLCPGLAACADDDPEGGLPTAPTDLRAVLAPAGGVELTWTDASDDEDKFVIERLEGEGTNFTELAEVDADAVAYVDKTAGSGKTYRYRVQAVNGYGEASSVEVAVTVP